MADDDGFHIPVSHNAELYLEPLHLLVARFRRVCATINGSIGIEKVPS